VAQPNPVGLLLASLADPLVRGCRSHRCSGRLSSYRAPAKIFRSRSPLLSSLGVSSVGLRGFRPFIFPAIRYRSRFPSPLTPRPPRTSLFVPGFCYVSSRSSYSSSSIVVFYSYTPSAVPYLFSAPVIDHSLDSRYSSPPCSAPPSIVPARLELSSLWLGPSPYSRPSSPRHLPPYSLPPPALTGPIFRRGQRVALSLPFPRPAASYRR